MMIYLPKFEIDLTLVLRLSYSFWRRKPQQLQYTKLSSWIYVIIYICQTDFGDNLGVLVEIQDSKPVGIPMNLS